MGRILRSLRGTNQSIGHARRFCSLLGVTVVLSTVIVPRVGASATTALAPTDLATAYRGAEIDATPPPDRMSSSRDRSYRLGFDVGRDGFSFSNWAGITPDDALTFANMARLFSMNATCVQDPFDASCTLRSGQRIYLSAINAFLAQGRCEGMTVLAARLFQFPREIQKLDPRARTTNELTPSATAREIAYYSVTQILPEIRGFTARTRLKSPYVLAQEVAFRLKLKRTVSLGIYGDGFAHSVIPIEVKTSPRETIFTVYDPNFPEETRTLRLNNLRGKWIYDDAVQPDGSIRSMTWKGPGRLDYVPINLRFPSN